MSDVVVGVMRDDKMDGEMVESLTGLLQAREVDGPIWARGYIGHLDLGRNEVIRRFWQETTADYLLFIDSDIVFTPKDFDAIYFRARKGNPIVSALYYRNSDPPTPAAFWFSPARQRSITKFKKGTVVQVDGCGFGFVMIRRDVIADMAKRNWNPDRPWCDNGMVGPIGRPLSEDMSFCMRAKDDDHQTVVDTSVIVGHVKSKVLYG